MMGLEAIDPKPRLSLEGRGHRIYPFCPEMLDEALSQGRPEVFNTDQGVQFTAEAFTARLESAGWR